MSLHVQRVEIDWMAPSGLVQHQNLVNVDSTNKTDVCSLVYECG